MPADAAHPNLLTRGRIPNQIPNQISNQISNQINDGFSQLGARITT